MEHKTDIHMGQMKMDYLGELRTKGTHLSSGNTILTDAPTDNNGKGEAYSPTDLVCSALSSCIMTIMGITARKEQIELGNMHSEITKKMSNNPRKISAIEVFITLESTIVFGLSEQQKELLKKVARTCPVALSLHPDIEQSIEFNF